MYDVIVVGVGPPGARFARQAARAGQSVLALEKGEIGTPLACSGHVSPDIWAFTGSDAKTTLLQNKIRGARFHVDGPGSKAYPFYKQETASNVIDRVGLDERLAALAVDAGADVRPGHTVTAIEAGANRVAVTVKGPDGVETVEGRIVVGADGPQSIVRRELDLPEPDEFLQGILAFDEAPDHGDFVDVHLTVPTFFAWRIPRGDAGVEYGLAAPTGSGFRERFDAFLADYGVTPASTHAGRIPIGPPERVTTYRGLLVGDAAGQTKPFTGGGILYGLAAADIAAETVDPADPATVAEYETGWRAALGREIRLGRWLRRGYSAPRPVQRAGLRLFEGEIGVHMDRPSSLFSRDQLAAFFR